MSSDIRRAVIAATIVVAVLVAGGFGLYALWQAVRSHTVAEECKVGDYSLDPSQASVAATMVGVVLKRDLPERASVLVLAAGLQESRLANLPPGGGDRDSVGVLQQRPSQGWGSTHQLQDLHYATGKFLDALLKIDGWEAMPLAQAVQKVQISVDGSFYARHEPEAQALANALAGKTPGGITCTFPKPTQVASAQTVADDIAGDLPINAPRATEPKVVVPGASWATAAWFVANADRLGIDSVAYSGREWTRAHGWRDRKSAAAAQVIATLHR